MTEITREQRLLQTFASLADTLVDGYDIVELLQLLVDSCRDLLDTTAAAILLADSTGELDVIVSTSEASRLVELIQLGRRGGPMCRELPHRVGRLGARHRPLPERWARFRDSALAQGFASVHAVPMRLRDDTIGTLNLLRETSGELDPKTRSRRRHSPMSPRSASCTSARSARARCSPSSSSMR